MAFNTNSGKQQFTATAGQTVFNFNFAIFADTDIRVYLTPAGNTANDALDILTLSINYNVSINGTLGGTVTLLSGATINDIITIVRALPVTRTTDYVTNGDLFADTLDSDQDYQTYLVVDGYVQLQRAIIVPESLSSVSLSIPAPVSNAYLRWNSLANALENDTTIPQAVLDSAASAAAALVSENAASASAASALSYLNDFKGRYYGALASDPLLDPLGNPIDDGDIYFNTTSFELKIYSSLVWSAWTVTSAQISSIINASASKTTPVAADKFPLVDNATGILNYVTLTNFEATLKTYFDTLYNSLVAEYTVTGAAVTSINFTGLDLNTHKSYRIEVEFLNATASGVSVAMFANGDTTATNYYAQRLYSAGATSVSVNGNNAYILYMQTSQPLKGDISIADTPSTLNATSNSAQGNTTGLVREMIAWAKTTAVANLTQLTFVASVASSIGIGSKIRIYRGDV